VQPRAVLFAILVTCAAATAFSTGEPERTDGVTFLPGSSIFTPLAANPEEVRVGVRREFGSTRMRLDIGSALDLVGYQPASDADLSLRIGAEMFVFALTTSYQGLHLQVDAVDGYFGGHITLRKQYASSTLYIRTRILHLSSHFIDGHFRLESLSWIDGQLPRPYSRDYVEVTAAYEPHGESWNLLLYAGFNQAWFCRPATMLRFNTFQGFVVRTSGWTGPVFGKTTTLYLADHFLLTGVGTLSGSNVLEGGIKFGTWEQSGIRLFISYHGGVEMYHQYFDVKRNDLGIGFSLDL
jgi:hypothetical protein